jgi:putative transposase
VTLGFSPPLIPKRVLPVALNYWDKADYRRRLPHFHREDAHLFVTWRLDGTLPAPVPDIIYTTPGHRFVAQDRALTHAPGPQWLADTRVAAVVAETLRSGEREMNLYELHAWTIMPNHVHILVLPVADPIKIMGWIKGSSARQANLVLARTGRFWQEESYDRWVRNRKEFCRIAHYIDENPVSAGFVSRAEEWPFQVRTIRRAEARPTKKKKNRIGPVPRPSGPIRCGSPGVGLGYGVGLSGSTTCVASFLARSASYFSSPKTPDNYRYRNPR